MEPDANADAPWTLPDWEEYSDAASRFEGDWSDVEADVSLDTASSVASTEHQRVYKLQRARGGFAEEKQRDLRDLHSLYTRRRLEESSMGAPSVRSSRSWLPVPCASPTLEKPPSPIEKEKKQVESELLTQQSEISAELQAVRKQLSDFQDKWKQTVEASREGGETSTAPTVSSSWSSPGHATVRSNAFVENVAIQTEDDERQEAVKQWLMLLVHKLNALAGKYAHEPTQAFQAAMDHLTGLRRSNGDSEEKNGDCEIDVTSPSSWHVGRALKTAVPLEVAEQFLELEQAIASMNAAMEKHERRQMTNFDRAVQQVQGYHHERLQRVVEESLAEVKLVRGRYKKKEATLEEELRIANKQIEHWKQSASDAEHHKKLDREALEFQLSTSKEQHENSCQRYEDEAARLQAKLGFLQADRQEIASQNKSTDNVISQAKERAEELENQLQALKKQQERAKELHDWEMRVLHDTIRKLREDNSELEVQHSSEKQSFMGTLQNLKTSHQAEKSALEARVRDDTEQRLLHDHIPEQMTILENRHKEAMRALESDHERTVARLTAQLKEYESIPPISICTTETQTDFPVAEDTAADDSQEKIDELSRRCRALEKLLDKKFEETPISLSSSQRCESCHSDHALSPAGSIFDTRQDLSTSLRSDTSSIRRASGKSKALARVLLGSSLEQKTTFTDEPTMATDEATLGAHEMWDSASFTSIDSMDDLASFASQRTTPRPATQCMKSTQEILSLVRQLKAGSPMPKHRRGSRREPDPEINWGSPSKQKHERDPPSWGAKSRYGAATPRRVGAGAPVASSASRFDDLLTDRVGPEAA